MTPHSSSLTGLGSSLSASAQSSFAHARLTCGARKMATAAKPFCPSGGVSLVQWDEDFAFHVPKTAPSLRVVFFDDKQSEVR